MNHSRETEFLFGENLEFITNLYKKYLENQKAVTPLWADVFRNMRDSLGDFSDAELGPSWKRKDFPLKETVLQKTVPSYSLNEQALKDSLGALMLIRLYRVRGHLAANLDPLQLVSKKEISELHPKVFGFEEEDWDRPIFLNGFLGYHHASLREIITELQKTYCGSVGVEFMHMIEPDQKQWIQEHFENPSLLKEFTKEEREKILKNIIQAESFEDFLNTKHKGAKRFGLEGCEALIPCLWEAIEGSAKSGVKDIVLGMAHRGRLNVLANIMGKPLETIFYGFTKSYQYCSSAEGAGDVKYHLGYSGVLKTGDTEVTVSLTPNPSHLEAVDAVVLGRVRAKQDLFKDANRSEVMGIIIHGDAAFPGQGVV